MLKSLLLKLSAAIIIGGWVCVGLAAGIIGTCAYLEGDPNWYLIVPVALIGGLVWSSPIFGIGLLLRGLATAADVIVPPGRRPPAPPSEPMTSGIPIGPRQPAPLAAHALPFTEVHGLRIKLD